MTSLYFFPQFLLNKSGLSKIRLIKRRQACNSHWREWRRDFSDRLLSAGALLWSSEAVGSDSLRFDSAGWILNHQRQSPFIQIWPLVKTLCCWFIQPKLCSFKQKMDSIMQQVLQQEEKTWVVCDCLINIIFIKWTMVVNLADHSDLCVKEMLKSNFRLHYNLRKYVNKPHIWRNICSRRIERLKFMAGASQEASSQKSVYVLCSKKK